MYYKTENADHENNVDNKNYHVDSGNDDIDIHLKIVMVVTDFIVYKTPTIIRI